MHTWEIRLKFCQRQKIRLFRQNSLLAGIFVVPATKLASQATLCIKINGRHHAKSQSNDWTRIFFMCAIFSWLRPYFAHAVGFAQPTVAHETATAWMWIRSKKDAVTHPHMNEKYVWLMLRMYLFLSIDCALQQRRTTLHTQMSVAIHIYVWNLSFSRTTAILCFLFPYRARRCHLWMRIV